MSNNSAAICRWLSRRSNQQGVGHFRAKFWEEGVDQCKPKFNHSGETCDCGCCMQRKSCQYLMLFEHNKRANYYWTLIEIVISDDQWRLEVISANANHLSSNDDANQSTGIVEKYCNFEVPLRLNHKQVVITRTRKLCYRKNDRAMRAI